MKFIPTLLYLLLEVFSNCYAQIPNEKPIRIIVPFSNGGPTDVVARVLGPKLAKILKRPVIIENKVGTLVALELYLLPNRFLMGHIAAGYQ